MKKLTLIITALIAIGISSCKKDDKTTTTTKPEACFTTSSTNISINGYIELTNCSKNATSYLWEFSNGYESTEEEPSYRFDSSGTYTIKLTASDNSGNKSIATKTITVTNQYAKYAGNWEIVEVISGYTQPTYISNISVDNKGRLTITNFGDYISNLLLTVNFSSFPNVHSGSKIVDLSSNTTMYVFDLEFRDNASPFEFSADGKYSDGTYDDYYKMSAIKQ